MHPENGLQPQSKPLVVGSPYARRAMFLCGDHFADDDDGPPWGPRPTVVDGNMEDE